MYEFVNEVQLKIWQELNVTLFVQLVEYLP